MPLFEMDLFSEIRFAKRHFDFVEITLRPGSLYTHNYVSKLKKALKNFEVLGHLYWGIDLSKGEIGEIENICRFISIFNKLGAKKITIHPSAGDGKNIREIRKNNLLALSKIADFCRKKEIQLLVENITKIPFKRESDLEYLVKNIPSLAVTLDVGHANRTSRLELDRFLKLAKIRHIHLHDNVGEKDHLPFTDKERLKKLIEKIKDSFYEGTITLETFFVLEGDNYLHLEGDKRREILLEQLELIKEL